LIGGKVQVLVINGPNLNLLGERKPEIYGELKLDEINKYIEDYFKKTEINFFQSNHEGEIIDKIHSAPQKYKGIVINAGAFTHYSYAIRDAIEAISIPTIEVHLSNISKREDFRQKSVIAPVCEGSISGFGKYSYVLAIRALVHNSHHKE
jgi:3-dehydroquinate dehydratase-2